MTSRVVSTEAEREALVHLIQMRPLPFTVDITKGKRRTVAQNRTQRLWLNEIAEQLGDRTAEEVRGYCKLTIGVPILRAENERFREAYDRHIKGRSYEDKLAIMMEPLDLPVTRLMTTSQKARYLNGIVRHFAEQGILLTVPRNNDEPAESINRSGL